MALDVSTGGELPSRSRPGVPPERLVLHGNNKSDDRARDGACVRSRPDRRRLLRRDRPPRRRCSAERGTVVGVLVRVTPGVEAHTHEFVMTGQEDSKFGFSLASGAAAEARRAAARDAGRRAVGVHAHIGSQIFASTRSRRRSRSSRRFVRRPRARELCVGGGLGVAYLERGVGAVDHRVGRRRSVRPQA